MKSKKQKKPARKPKKPLDRVSKKRRGRPPNIPKSWVTGRAYNHRLQLKQMWKTLEGPLLKAQTLEEVTAAFREYGKQYADQFAPRFVADILALIHDPKFPKRREARINFLADSLGGRPSVSFRTSRDICEEERKRQQKKSPHHIIRKEFYVECSCGYEGPARNNACPDCGAEISFSFQESIAGGSF